MRRKMSRREDYLKLIYTLSQKGEVRGADLADELGIKRPTVCVYLKRLAENGDVIMDEHHCVCLTNQGLKIAEATLDKHGMLLALLQDLGVPSNIATLDACAIEHSISPETYSALKQLLNERQAGVPGSIGMGKDSGHAGRNSGSEPARSQPGFDSQIRCPDCARR